MDQGLDLAEHNDLVKEVQDKEKNMAKQMLVYTVGCISKQGTKGIVLIYHDLDEVIEMIKTVVRQGERPTLETEVMSFRAYVNQNWDNLSPENRKALLQQGENNGPSSINGTREEAIT